MGYPQEPGIGSRNILTSVNGQPPHDHDVQVDSRMNGWTSMAKTQDESMHRHQIVNGRILSADGHSHTINDLPEAVSSGKRANKGGRPDPVVMKPNSNNALN